MLVASLFITSIVNADDPTVTLNPESPTAQSTVTFTADLGDENATNVWITIEECNGNTGVCYPDKQNVSMEQVEETNVYEKDVTLIHDSATYITYLLEIETELGWQKYDSVKIYLSDASDDNQSNNVDRMNFLY